MGNVSIKMISRLAGPDGVIQPGQVRRVPEHVADDLIAGGFAMLTSEPAPAIQEAIVKPPEKAVIRRKRTPSRGSSRQPAKRKHASKPKK